ncbi:MAG TPA: hypothetical protein VJ837_01060, partial [Candidatus Paceibacterota bacterium]|nr:hypothetical protein [Candidatus Paceibacterota bacterium]
DGLFKLVSFSTRHNSFRDPDEIFGCEECGEGKQDQYHGGGPALPDEDPDDYHEYKPREEVAFILNYYEHGLCRWYVAPNASPVDMQWDGVYGAGALILAIEESERAWWDEKTDEEKRKSAEIFAAEYTAWSNGECYGYTIKRKESECPTCGQEREGETLDSCGGYIVSWESRDYFRDEILFSLADALGIRIPQVTDADYETAPKLVDLIKVGEHFSVGGEYENLF